MEYKHLEVEKKWQDYWDTHETFKTDVWNFSKPKFYALDMFPYPSGHGLHVGHPEGYTASDIVCRMKRMQGYNVLHPMGWDAFGLPAEQYAISTGNHPEGFTQANIETFKRQLKMLGFSFDWSKEISTADPNYYRWTQWIFKQLFEDGYARLIDVPVNWCEELGTVLANDEIIDGKSERGGYPIVRKNMKQWVIDIPKYAQRLLDGLDSLDWPESTKEIQRNWIGKSIGAQVEFKVANQDASFMVYTTRCDTLFGATYCVLSPEHQLVDTITTSSQQEAVKAYQKECASKSDLERTELNKNKSGVFIGAYAINPVNQKQVPIWIADYVLATYGSGAIMAVPAHDERDYEFAKKFDLEIISVIEGGDVEVEAYSKDGLHINSGFLNGLNKEDAIAKMLSWLEEKQIGMQKTNYKLREWIFARQRYWGEPIPVTHFDDASIALRDEELPLLLPELDDYKGINGKAPLDKAEAWKTIELNGKVGQRETSTMPGSAGSSWYFLRYIDPHNDECLADKQLLEHWMPVDLYIGGSEHAVGHLLYSRFWNNYLYDKGIVPTKEPFQKLCHQGMILGANNEKMSKSRGNVVNPDDMVKGYGADALRMYEMFMGPIEASKPWDPKGIEGARRFIDRVWRLFDNREKFISENDHNLDYIYNFTIKKVENDIETLNFNTAISQMMIFINECYKCEKVYDVYFAEFIKLFSCFAPHIGEEIYQLLGNVDSIAYATWPVCDESKIVKDSVEVIFQVNGKLRAKEHIAKDLSQAELEKVAFSNEAVKNNIEGREICKVICVVNKLVNIVVK